MGHGVIRAGYAKHNYEASISKIKVKDTHSDERAPCDSEGDTRAIGVEAVGVEHAADSMAVEFELSLDGAKQSSSRLKHSEPRDEQASCSSCCFTFSRPEIGIGRLNILLRATGETEKMTSSCREPTGWL